MAAASDLFSTCLPRLSLPCKLYILSTVSSFHSFIELHVGCTLILSPVDRGLTEIWCIHLAFCQCPSSPCVLALLYRSWDTTTIRVFVRRPMSRCAGLVVIPSCDVLRMISKVGIFFIMSFDGLHCCFSCTIGLGFSKA